MRSTIEHKVKSTSIINYKIKNTSIIGRIYEIKSKLFIEYSIEKYINHGKK